MKNSIIIGIAGGSASGKTSISRQVYEFFKGSHTTCIIKQDDYYKDQSHLSFEERVKTNYDHPFAFDNDLLVEQLKQLKEAGYDLHFYRLAKNEFEMAEQDPEVKMIRLATIDKMDTVAVIGSLPATIPAAEFAIPEKGIDELTKEIEDSQKQIAECDED